MEGSGKEGLSFLKLCPVRKYILGFRHNLPQLDISYVSKVELLLDSPM